MTTETAVELYVDPSCPFAWITSRWLLEVAARRPVRPAFRLMSLSVINEDRELEPWYREFNDRAWAPARVGAAIEKGHGAGAFAAYYSAFGTEIHANRGTDRPAAIAAGIAAARVPGELAGAAESAEYDALLRRAHDAVRALVGDDLGTPVIVLDGAAFFGPVCDAIPRGDDAVALFDAVRLAARCPSFAELKRSRGPLRFD